MCLGGRGRGGGAVYALFCNGNVFGILSPLTFLDKCLRFITLLVDQRNTSESPMNDYELTTHRK